MAEEQQDSSKFQIFRAKDAPGLMEAKCMTVEPFSPVQRAGMDRAMVRTRFDNARGVALYRSVGFRDDHVERWFTRA